MPLLSHPLPQPLLELFSTLSNSHFETWLVGGSVRDILLGRPVIDYDLATAATPDELKYLFGNERIRCGDFGNSTLIMDGHRFELTTFRNESNYTDHRHPLMVSFVQTYEEDWPRRDFSINALAYNPLSQIFIDPAEGLVDLTRKLIRTIGDPIIRFEEDALRMLRAIRLASECCLYIETATLSAINPERFEKAVLSNDQLEHELTRIWKSAEPDLGLFYLNKTKILRTTHPHFSRQPFYTMSSIKSIENWRERRNHAMLTSL